MLTFITLNYWLKQITLIYAFIDSCISIVVINSKIVTIYQFLTLKSIVLLKLLALKQYYLNIFVIK